MPLGPLVLGRPSKYPVSPVGNGEFTNPPLESPVGEYPRLPAVFPRAALVAPGFPGVLPLGEMSSRFTVEAPGNPGS